MSGPNVLVTVQRPLYEELTTEASRAKLHRLAGKLVFNESGDPWSQSEVIDRIEGADAVINGWGSCTFDEKVLDAAPNLKIICYSAGSIRSMAPPVVFERGIRLTHAAQVIAEAVAEFTLATVLALLRRGPDYAAAMRKGGWTKYGGAAARARPSRELYGKRYGIVGASMVGRSLLPLLRPFHVEALVYDPYLTEEAADELGVRKVDLPELMSTSDVISLHAPILPETREMIDGPLLRAIKDDAVFVNNARAWLVDYTALLEELKKERFDAALDVFNEEPLPDDSPFRRLERTALTPHLAGNSDEARSRLIGSAVDELERYLLGKPLLYEVTRERLATMA